MNKQTLIDDYKQTIERLQKECTEKTDFNIKLMERVNELEQKFDAQFAEMEEKLTAEEMKNFKLKEKLKIAEEFIEFLAGGICSDNICKNRENKNCLVCFENKAQEALQKINEVSQ